LKSLGCGVLGLWGLWHRNHAGCFSQLWHSPQLQTHVEEVLCDPTQLICAGLEEPRANAIRACSLSDLDLPELLSHLCCYDEQVRAGGVGGV